MDNRLVTRLQNDYPMFEFVASDKARWSPTEQKIYYTNDSQIEREAWNVAIELAPTYGLNIDNDVVERALDTYRDWLHQRSLCPKCGQTGIQNIKTLSYSCPNCQRAWRATAGKNTRLKRLSI